MEPQAAIVVPGEDGCLTVHAATQSLDAVQQGLAMTLGMPANKINVGAPQALGFTLLCAAASMLCSAQAEYVMPSDRTRRGALGSCQRPRHPLQRSAAFQPGSCWAPVHAMINALG